MMADELPRKGSASRRGEEPEEGEAMTPRSSWLLEPTRLETTPEELEEALEKHDTIVTSLVAMPYGHVSFTESVSEQ